MGKAKLARKMRLKTKANRHRYLTRNQKAWTGDFEKAGDWI